MLAVLYNKQNLLDMIIFYIFQLDDYEFGPSWDLVPRLDDFSLPHLLHNEYEFYLLFL